MFNRQAQLLQITSKLLDTLIIALNGVGGKLTEFVRDSLGFGDLARSDARSFLVEYVLQLDGKYFAVLVELLGRDIRDRVASQQRQFLEGIFVALVVEQLQHGIVTLIDELNEDLLPETLTRDLLLDRLAKLHLPAVAGVGDARKVLEGLTYVFVEQWCWWCFLEFIGSTFVGKLILSDDISRYCPIPENRF